MGQKETADYKDGYCQIMNELVIRLEIPKDIAEACCKSIGIEAGDALNRSNIELGYDQCLEIKIRSEDLHALRAALNTYLRWVIMCFDLLSKNATDGTNPQGDSG